MKSFIEIYDDIIQEGSFNMAKGNFVVEGGYYKESLSEAVKFASQKATRDGNELKVYQAVKLVSPKTPDVDVTDVVLA